MATISRFIRTHVRHTIVAAGLIVAVAVGGVAYAVTSSDSGSSPPPTTVPAPAAQAPAAQAPATKPRPVRGTITAIAPGSWTVTTKKGQAFTVTVTAQTQLGTRKAPLTASSFAVGDSVVISGTQSGTTVVATKIIKAPAKAAGSTPSASTTVPATAPQA